MTDLDDGAAPPLVPADTVLTDRQLLVHILQHVEVIDTRLGEFAGLVDELGPLLDKARKRSRLARLG